MLVAHCHNHYGPQPVWIVPPQRPRKWIYFPGTVQVWSTFPTQPEEKSNDELVEFFYKDKDGNPVKVCPDRVVEKDGKYVIDFSEKKDVDG